MASTEIESDHPDKGLPGVTVGATDGDAAGMVYVQTRNGMSFFGPKRAKRLLEAVTEAYYQAKLDAATAQVTISVPPGATDAEIVIAVRAALGLAE